MIEPTVKHYTAEEFENLPWLHVYPQYSWHGELRIVGNASAFRALAAALIEAAETGRAETEASVIDGEGYSIEIQRTNTTGLRLTSRPYVAEWCRNLKTNPEK